MEAQTNMTNETLDSWDHFTGSNFLKTIHVANEQDAFVVTSIEIYSDEDNSPKPRLTVEKKGESYLFDLNVTNSNFCKNNGINNPKQLVGKKMYFKKVLVNSPKTKKEVESLRISKIE
jgi:ABC-type tungstate transport system permease subunit